MSQQIIKKIKGVGLLLLIATGLIFFFGVISPAIVDRCPMLAQYGEVQNLYGLHSASVYYTDQPTLAETQTQVRRALITSGHLKDQDAAL